MKQPATGETIEKIVRASYGRLLAYLISKAPAISEAEDALAESIFRALTIWPKSAIPDNPDAWLLTVARNILVDGSRRTRHLEEKIIPQLALDTELFEAPDEISDDFPDERLKLLFVCTHPAIDREVRSPLMLQTVLGLDAAKIASAFLVKPVTMGQRLSRAKSKIRAAGIPFEVPDFSELPDRLDAVLDAIYAAYTHGWEGIGGADARIKDLSSEAIELGTIIVELLPQETEPKGLLALMLFCEARRPARISDEGRFVPLLEQDPARWSLDFILSAEKQLASAFKGNRAGRFQLEAAIQAVHCDRLNTGSTDWKAISGLYDQLVSLAPSVGALLGQVAAKLHGGELATAAKMLDQVPEDVCKDHQPYWALRANLHSKGGQTEAAESAYRHAISLTADKSARDFLLMQLENLKSEHRLSK